MEYLTLFGDAIVDVIANLIKDMNESTNNIYEKIETVSDITVWV